VKNFFFIFFCLLLFGATSQEVVTEWGALQRSNGRLIKLLHESNGDFYALRWVGGNLLGKYKISRHEGMNQVARGSISLKVPGGIGTFEAVHLLGDKLVVFLSDKRGEKRLLYMQEYSRDIEPLEEPEQIASYEIDKLIDRSWFDVIKSNNQAYFAVVWEIPGKKEERDRYGFRVFDRDMSELNNGDYRLPFAAELSTIHGHHLSNNGDYFLSISEFNRTDGVSLFNNNREFIALHIYHIGKDGLQDYTLDVNDRRIEAMALSSGTKDSITVTGLYGAKDTPGVDGVFYQRIDLKEGTTIAEGFKKFDEDFITQDWTERELQRSERREERGRGTSPQLYNYRMREAIVQSDGSILGTMEQYYIQLRNSSSAQTGDFSNNYHYFYNDIIAYKIGVSGEFEWVTKVRKVQVSVNDGGPYSSYESYVADGKLYFIFNDHSGNYTDTGAFIDDERLYAANYSKRRNVVSLVGIDIDNGSMERKPFFDRSEIEALVVPKLFHVNYATQEVLLYAIWGRKEKFGLLRF
jgi:hypothetical protein